MKRRRALGVIAGFAAFPAFAAAPLRWEGVALGADVRMELSGPEEITRPALRDALVSLRRIETLFSLYDPASYVSRLNRDGELLDAPSDFLTLMEIVDDVHSMTEGVFDPTVQTVWPMLAARTRDMRFTRVNWPEVRRKGAHVTLGRDQQVTFNGIAQGFATDAVVGILKAHGLTDSFVDLGEPAVVHGTRRLGVVDPRHGRVGDITLKNTAVATSSPAATPLGRHGHIIMPKWPGFGAPKWSTVTVEAESATLADGLSTAMCLMELRTIRRLRRTQNISRVLLVDHDGNVSTI